MTPETLPYFDIQVEINPIEVFELLFFAVFGQTSAADLQTTRHQQVKWTENLFKMVFGVYMLVSVVVLINLLIAMMTDTYQRIQAQSDIEWKFGLSKLIRNMHRTTTAPSPINLITTWLFYLVDVCRERVQISPFKVFGLLSFAVFGQTTVEELQTKHHPQSEWTENLIRATFGIYNMVSIIVLINLLIAMLTDTYQRIQAQSDIEWKFGLTRLIRSMQRTTTAHSPINLITTWLFYLVGLYRKRIKKAKKRPDVLSIVNTLQGKQLSPRSKAGAKWLSKINRKSQVAPKPEPQPIHSGSSRGSEVEFALQGTRIEHVVEWGEVSRKYRERILGYTAEAADSGNPKDEESENRQRRSRANILDMLQGAPSGSGNN